MFMCMFSVYVRSIAILLPSFKRKNEKRETNKRRKKVEKKSYEIKILCTPKTPDGQMCVCVVFFRSFVRLVTSSLFCGVFHRMNYSRNELGI